MAGYRRPQAFLEGRERRLAGGGVDRPVDPLQRAGHGLAVLVGDEIEAVPQQVDDAGLHRGVWKHGQDRLGKPLQAVDDGEQHVLDAAVVELVHDAQPELCPFVLLEPEAEDFLGSVGPNAQRPPHHG